MPTLHLVRHGRPLTGPGPRSGWPLDPAHTEAVVGLGESGVLPKEAEWYTSPERRAVETARLLSDAEPFIVGDLREQNRPDEWADDFADTVERGLRVQRRSPAPGWETAISVGDRLTRVVSALPPHDDVVLVGHGTAWTLLIANLTPAPGRTLLPGERCASRTTAPSKTDA